MVKRTGKRIKHIPQRTCVGCHQVLPKRSLVRLVRTEEGVRIDQTGKLAGRGAYLHDRRDCWAKGLKGALARALKVELSDQDQQNIMAFLVTLPDDDETGESSVAQN